MKIAAISLMVKKAKRNLNYTKNMISVIFTEVFNIDFKRERIHSR